MGCGASAGPPAPNSPNASAQASSADASSSAAPEPPRTPQAQPVIGTATSSTTVASDADSPQKPAAQSSPSSEHPKYPDWSYVLIQGIEKKPELNGQVGLIVNFDGGPDRRYTVRVAGTQVRLREDKLSLAPSPPPAAPPPPGFQTPKSTMRSGSGSGDFVDNLIASVSADSVAPPPPRAANSAAMQAAQRREDEKLAFMESMPMGELTATGRLVPTYQWVQVPPVASLPPGMEVWMPVGGNKCARIPETWRLQVVAEGQVDSYRVDVGEHTPVIDIMIGAASRFGWEVHELELRGEGKPIELPDEATVGSAGLFGRKLTACNYSEVSAQ